MWELEVRNIAWINLINSWIKIKLLIDNPSKHKHETKHLLKKLITSDSFCDLLKLLAW